MTNEERDALIAQGWTPPVAVDPDLAEAEKVRQFAGDCQECGIDGPLAGIKRGRELERAEAKPGRWSSWNGAPSSPVCDNDWVCVIYDDQSQAVGRAGDRGWEDVSSYLPIPKPEDVA